jgi:excinuclease ABC subunit B
MQRALAEMDRRRAKQIAYNAEHGIVPRSIRKDVKDIMEGARGAAPGESSRRRALPLAPEQAVQQIRKLEAEMYRLARNLEFERAARLRDEIAAIRAGALGAEAEKLAG